MVSQGRRKSETKICIIEIKYCIDTKPKDQLKRAREQHEELVRKLVDSGYLRKNISISPLLIGVSGTIYRKHTLKALEKLGVAGKSAKTCTSKLHKEAIKSLHDIVKTRQHTLHTCNSKGTPPKPP